MNTRQRTWLATSLFAAAGFVALGRGEKQV